MLRLVLALFSLSILACSSQDDAKPAIDQVVPSQIAPNIATSIEIRGQHLYRLASVDLDDKQPVQESSDFRVHIGQQEIARTDVSQTSSEQVVVQLPPLSEGVYDVVLTLPNSNSATLPQGLQVGTPPMVDAGLGTRCEQTYGMALSFDLCEESFDSCRFYVQTNEDTCTNLCTSFGGDCIDNYDGDCSTAIGSQGCDIVHFDQVCICSRP